MDNPPIIVAGMHRSGTSLAASILDGLGVAMGSDNLPADRNNTEGYFEDLSFVELQSRMMADATPQDDGGHPDWGWTEHELLDPGRFDLNRSAALALVRARAGSGNRWGWKNPRTTLQLDFWDELLERPRYLLLYRFPWEVAESMQHLGAEVFLRHPEYAYLVWQYYNRHLVAFADRVGDRAVLISANALLAEPEIAERILRQRLGLDVPDGFVRSKLRPHRFRSGALAGPLARLLRKVRPGCLKLLADLDQRSELPSPQVGTSGAALVPTASSPAPRVSVLIPCHNHGEFLLEAVASVEAAQEGTAFELIVINDGSTQPWTLDVLQHLRELGYRILDQPKQGLAAARNAGAAAAHGTYLLPLDADNRVRPEFTEAAVGTLEEDASIGVVYGDRYDFGLREASVRVPEFSLPLLLLGNYVDACALLRRSVWERVGGWDPQLPAWEDWDFWIGAADQGWRFSHWPHIAFDYRVRPGSLVAMCKDADTGKRLQSYIVEKHRNTYLKYLPTLVEVCQERASQTHSVAFADLADQLSNTINERERIDRHRHEVIAERDTYALQATHYHGLSESLMDQLAAQAEEQSRLAAALAALEEQQGRSAAAVVELEEQSRRSTAELTAALAEAAELRTRSAASRLRIAEMEATRAWRLRQRLIEIKGWLMNHRPPGGAG